MRGNGLGDVVENADDAEHRRGIDAFAAGLVVERNVAAGDGRAEGGAGFGDAVDGGGELGHDLRLFRIAEVEAVGGGHGSCAGHGHLARGFGHGVHGAELGIEIRPAAVAVEGHGEAALVARRAGALDAHDAGFAAGADDGVGLHHGVVLLVDPALGADVGAGEQLFEVGGEVAVARRARAATASGGSSGTGDFHVPTGRW